MKNVVGLTMSTNNISLLVALFVICIVGCVRKEYSTEPRGQDSAEVEIYFRIENKIYGLVPTKGEPIGSKVWHESKDGDVFKFDSLFLSTDEVIFSVNEVKYCSFPCIAGEKYYVDFLGDRGVIKIVGDVSEFLNDFIPPNDNGLSSQNKR